MAMSKTDVHDAIVCAVGRLRSHAAGSIDADGELTQAILEIEAILPVLEAEAAAEAKAAEEEGIDDDQSAYALIQFSYHEDGIKRGRKKLSRIIRFDQTYTHLGGDEGETADELKEAAARVAARELLQRRDDEAELRVEIHDVEVAIDMRPEEDVEKGSPSDEMVEEVVKQEKAVRRKEVRSMKEAIKKGDLIAVTLPDGQIAVIGSGVVRNAIDRAEDYKKERRPVNRATLSQPVSRSS